MGRQGLHSNRGRGEGQLSASFCEHVQSLASGVDPAMTQQRPGTWEDGRLPRDKNPGQVLVLGEDKSEPRPAMGCAWKPWLQHRTLSTHQILLGCS